MLQPGLTTSLAGALLVCLSPIIHVMLGASSQEQTERQGRLNIATLQCRSFTNGPFSCPRSLIPHECCLLAQVHRQGCSNSRQSCIGTPRLSPSCINCSARYTDWGPSCESGDLELASFAALSTRCPVHQVGTTKGQLHTATHQKPTFANVVSLLPPIFSIIFLLLIPPSPS